MSHTMQVTEIEKILSQMENQNKDFKFYFNCLNFREDSVQKEIDKTVEKALAVDTNKKINSKKAKLIKRARFLVKDDSWLIKENVKALKELVEQAEIILPDYCPLKNLILNNNGVNKEINDFKKTNGLRLILIEKEFKQNLISAKDYVLPNANKELKKRALLEQRISQKFNALPKKSQKDEEYDFKFGKEM